MPAEIDSPSAGRRPTIRDVPRRPDGFTYTVRGGDIHIRHHGRPAGTLRGSAAERFLADVARYDPLDVMARVTGNYKHGNERTAKRHPRNSAL